GTQLVDGLTRQRVDQPRLSAGELERAIDRGRLKHLPGVRRVLAIELGHLVTSEPGHRQRLDLDVEGTRGPESALAVVDLVVTNIAKPDQRDRPRKPPGPLPIARSQLAKHRD